MFLFSKIFNFGDCTSFPCIEELQSAHDWQFHSLLYKSLCGLYHDTAFLHVVIKESE